MRSEKQNMIILYDNDFNTYTDINDNTIIDLPEFIRVSLNNSYNIKFYKSYSLADNREKLGCNQSTLLDIRRDLNMPVLPNHLQKLLDEASKYFMDEYKKKRRGT
jgi:hypothetical protein